MHRPVDFVDMLPATFRYANPHGNGRTTSMAINPQATESMANPGVTLRAVRNRMGWTLAEVGKRTGLPVSTLSKIENGKMSLSYDKLVRLSEGLDIDIAQLFATDTGAPPAALNGRRSITRAGEGSRSKPRITATCTQVRIFSTSGSFRSLPNCMPAHWTNSAS